MNYEDKLLLLNDEDFFHLFLSLGGCPRWVTSNGKRAIQIQGRCHGSTNYSALFDPTTMKVNCFSTCGGGMFLHTWVMRAGNLNSVIEAKDLIEDWIEDKGIDLSDRVGRDLQLNLDFQEREYKPSIIDAIEPMPKAVLEELYQHQFSTSREILNKLVWHKDDGISADILSLYDVAYYPAHGTIILPHHNKNGDIVGLYERSFKPLRKKAKEKYPDMPWSKLAEYPRAKYVPLLREEKYRTEEKSSWSFPNSYNLYGLHLAKEHIQKTGKAIIFEGAKSVMLARQYGYPYAVASHTFGAHLNHISLLLEYGAKEIILAFDKQYQKHNNTNDKEWNLYVKKTNIFAEKVLSYCTISIIEDKEQYIGYKDSPADHGQNVFDYLYESRRTLSRNRDSIFSKNENQSTGKYDNISRYSLPLRVKDNEEYQIIKELERQLEQYYI